jgi:type II secretory pathway pseudopilin PulG
MFSIIIALISIVLVAVLAGAVIYYGGDSFSKGTAKAKAAEILNQAEMIKGAFTTYKVTEGDIEIDSTNCDVLANKIDGCLDPLKTKNYLTDIPVGSEGWYIDSDKTLRRTLGTNVKACAIANYVNGAPLPENPEKKSLDLDTMKTDNVVLFRTYIPVCINLTGQSAYICCENIL